MGGWMITAWQVGGPLLRVPAKSARGVTLPQER